jgi:hypothetical protein
MRGSDLIRRAGVACGLAAALALGLSSAAIAGGGTQPSNAPTVSLHTKYAGIDKQCTDANCGVDFWRLPSLLRGDLVTVTWSSHGPAMCLTGNIQDFTWTDDSCNLIGGTRSDTGTQPGGGVDHFRVGAAAKKAFVELLTTVADGVGSYSFTVDKIQHQIRLTLTTPARLKRSAHLHAKAVLTSGAPVPNGLQFTLVARWAHHTAKRSATTKNGTLSFSLGLPRSAHGKRVSFRASRASSASYLAVVAPRNHARVR